MLDPCCGSAVRGLVAQRLGREYVGIDIRPEQVEANRAELDPSLGPPPLWLAGDGREAERLAGEPVDLVFSCPPYADLERYSRREDDLSNMRWEVFKAEYSALIMSACAALAEDRFAVWVVGEVRDRQGWQRDLLGLSVDAFRAAGLPLYNRAVYIPPLGSLPMRARRRRRVR